MNHEDSILGAAIIEPSVVPLICGELVPEDFTSTQTRNTFLAIRSLWKCSKPIDLVTLTSELERMEFLNQVEAVVYLADVMSFTPTAANTKSYIDIMHETRKRSIFTAGMKKAISIASNGSDGFMAEARTTLDSVSAIGAADIKMLGDLLPEVTNRLGDTTRGKQTGYPGLDAVTGGFREGHLVIIAARPGIGKTALACNISANMCRTGLACAYFSIEMSALEIAERINLSEAMVDKYKAQKDPNLARLVTNAQEKVWNWKLCIDDRGSLSVDQIVSNAYQYKQRAGSLDCIFVDYLQLMRLPGGKNDSKNERIGEATRGLKVLAKEIKCPVVALAQLNRNADGRRPTIADIRDSGNIEQDADLILLLHREHEQSEQATLIIGKNRHGATRDIPMLWKHEWTRYLETTRMK